MALKTSFWKNVNPAGAIGDLLQVFRDAGPHRLRYSLLAAMATLGVFSIMVTQSWKKQRQLPEVTYINSWPADRSAQETRRFIAENQKKKETLQAQEAAAAKQAQELWMAVGKASGIDVEQIKREADAEKARAEAASKQAPQVRVER